MSNPLSAVGARLGAARSIVLVVFLALYAALLFTRLGEYALWDDEANTALFAQGVWSTGDTSAVIGHNVIAYRSGLELRGLKNRLIAPLPYFFLAPWVGLFPGSALAARLPFALMGLLSAAFMFWWLWRINARLRTWILLALGLLGNVSLILYSRQARYYPLALFASLVVLYCYARFDGRRRMLLGLCGGASVLLAAHYLAYAGLGLAVGLDYLVFGWWSAKRRFRWWELAAIVGSQVLTAAVIVGIWNPLGKPVTGYVPASWISDRLTLLWWNLRDLNTAEFGVLMVMAAAPVVWLLSGRKDSLLLRIPFALVAYGAAVAAFSPQPVGWAHIADIRYMAATIPACIFLVVRVLEAIPFAAEWPRLALGALLFLTNFVQSAFGQWIGAPDTPPVRSTLVAYVGELQHPQRSPYRAAANWLNNHAERDSSVYVWPEFGIYPLMFHSPQLVYAWQFEDRYRADYPTLPDIHFKYRELPDYFVAFGGEVMNARRFVQQLAQQGRGRYDEVARLPVYGRDMTRPELFWRSFVPVPVRNPAIDGVYIFKKLADATGPQSDAAPR